MKRNSLYSIILILLSLWGCEDYYVPELDQMPNALVVEAILTDKAEPMTLKLSRSLPFNDHTFLQGERKAYVKLMTTDGEAWDFHELGSGNYQSNDNIITSPGKGYYLRIKTNDGEVYESDVEVMMEHCGISDVQFTDSIEKEVNYSYWGDPYVTNFEGIEISVLPDQPDNPDAGFLYQWSSLINYFVFSSEMMSSYSYYCWKKMRSNAIYVYDYNEQDQANTLILDNLHFLSYYNIYPRNLDSTQFLGTISSALATSFYYYLEQYTITKRGADFWKSVKKQSEATGKLFDPVNEEIESNIHCTSNPDLRCFGIFNTAAYSNRVVLVDIESRKVKTYYTVKDFPVPKEDEDCILSEQPDFWLN